MINLSGLSIVLALLLLPAPTWSQQSTSPAAGTELPTLQEAIYAAEPGAVLRADLYGPPGQKGHIIVDRPLTLIGGTYLSITISASGRVFLRDAQVIAGMREPYGPEPYPAIEISGSDLLVGIINSQVLARGYATYLNCTGKPAVNVDYGGATLLLVGSTFQATVGGGPGELTCAATCGGRPAVEADYSVVYAWNSEFYGGGEIRHRWAEEAPCADAPLFEPPAPGGPGLTAAFLWHRGCNFVGGPGSYWDTWPSVGPDGPPFVAGWHKELPLFGSKAKPR